MVARKNELTLKVRYEYKTWCISILIVATSCKREQASKAVNPATFTYTYYNNSKIDTAAGQAINAGNFTVFEYTHVFADDISIADDEHRDRIIFQIPNNQTSFTITDSQLSTAILKRWRYCFCILLVLILIPAGLLPAIN